MIAPTKIDRLYEEKKNLYCCYKSRKIQSDLTFFLTQIIPNVNVTLTGNAEWKNAAW